MRRLTVLVALSAKFSYLSRGGPISNLRRKDACDAIFYSLKYENIVVNTESL